MAATKRMKRALVSVFHKDGLDEILKKLHSEGVSFVSRLHQITSPLVGGKLEFQFETFSNERSRAICFNCSFHQERQKEENPRSIFYAFHLTTHSVHHESGRI